MAEERPHFPERKTGTALFLRALDIDDAIDVTLCYDVYQGVVLGER